jgi:RNA polymerase-binding transcription factor DksA
MHGDECDVAAVFEETQRNAALARVLAGPVEEPDEDDQGNRYCLDCGETIPPARVLAVKAVRCVDCATIRERQNRSVLGNGAFFDE